MDVKELNHIISYIDLVKIKNTLEQRGYRCASKNGVWEFDPMAIAQADKVENGERYEEVFDDKIYVGDIHSEVKQYPDIEFIVITVNKIYRDKDNYEQPIEMLLYTNAPINKTYEIERLKIAKCAMCKKPFSVGELCEINGKLICDGCFEKDLQRLKMKGKSKLIKKK